MKSAAPASLAKLTAAVLWVTVLSYPLPVLAFSPLAPNTPLNLIKSTFPTSSPVASKLPLKSLQSPSTASRRTRLYFFEGLDKAFEEEGPLGKGITVGKLQIALTVDGRERLTPSSIFSILEKNARGPQNEDDGGYDDDFDGGTDSAILSRMSHEVCMTLLRKSDDWIAACSESKWFKGDDYGKAESLYNQWADREAAKFEKEYIPDEGSNPMEGTSTVAVVSIILEIQGDETSFERAGFSIAETKAVLTSIASDCRVEGGDCLNAVEVFWTPSEPTEVLTERDTILDFPELISF